MGRTASRFVNPLGDEEREILRYLEDHAQTPRIRHRAHAILLSDSGKSVNEIAGIFETTRESVCSWLTRWEDWGPEGLADGARSGAPPKLSKSEKKKVLRLAERAAQSDATVLIKAESGTGKELIARFIHMRGSRRNKPFLAVNCAALPDSLLESELFGYEKGAFTGADASKMGKFELANGGTLLLDEISELAPLLQAKLLRVLQEREVDRVGGREPIPIDVRVIAITNRDLEDLVRTGKFREDLFYRLNVIPLSVLPLRRTKKDIPVLVRYFSEKYSSGKAPLTITDERMKAFMEYSWPGNVRELENVIQRLSVIGDGGEVDFTEVRGPSWVDDSKLKMNLEVGMTLKEAERALIIHTLKGAGGNRTQAARILGIGLRTLRNKLREYRECGMTIPD